MASALSDDITELRGLLGSVYLTPRQRAALGRLLGSAARSPDAASASRSPLPPPVSHGHNGEGRCKKCGARSCHGFHQAEAPILTEAEKERERAELLGPIGGGQ